MIRLSHSEFQLKNRRFAVPNLTIAPLDYWAIVGSNGSGKSLLAQILQNSPKMPPLVSGEMQHDFARIAHFSFERQQQMLEAIFNARNNDCISPDDFGVTAREVILDGAIQPELAESYAEQLGITRLLDRHFMQLSTGESRKVLLCQTLVRAPDLLILDEPFEGLDHASVALWLALLAKLHEKMALVLIVNRLSDIPLHATHLALLDNLQLVAAGARAEVEADPLFQQLVYAQDHAHAPLPEAASPRSPLPENQPRFELKNVQIQYGERKIIHNLTWTVNAFEHWWIKGENGAGKSTLLSILTGDHPQAYANHVVLFGKQRGSGETIWDIKRNIGYVSSQLQMDYRVNCSALEVIISGFFDSIGVYQQVPAALKLKAQEWVRRIGLEAVANRPFRSLSWGQQRLLLITRAMVKHPPVLILDEPLQGLDGLNRTLVKQFIAQLVENADTQLLFVSHQDQDAPECITHLFEFVPENGGYRYVQKAIR